MQWIWALEQAPALQHDFEEAISPLDKHDRPLLLAQLALAAACAGDVAAARGWLDQARQALGTHVVLWRAEERLTTAAALLRLGAPEEARPHVAEGLRLFWRCGSRHRVAWGLEMVAALESCSGNLSRAARLWGAAEAIRAQIGAPMWPVDRPDYERRVIEARGQLGDKACDAAWQAGGALNLEQAAGEALAGLGTEIPLASTRRAT
jgi:hypothetical protein